MSSHIVDCLCGLVNCYSVLRDSIDYETENKHFEVRYLLRWSDECRSRALVMEVHTFVFVICSRRGERIVATKDVENSISSMAMLPSLVSKHFEKGSV